MIQSTQPPDKTLNIYYVASFLEQLMFLIPVWLIWFTKFMTVGMIGTLTGMGLVLTLVLSVPIGAMADRYGRKKMMAFGKMNMALGCLVCALASSVHGIIAAQIFWSIAKACVTGSGTALIYDYLKNEGREADFVRVRTKAVTWSRLAVIIASFTGGYLYSVWERLPYLLYAFTSLLEAGLWLAIQEPAKVDNHVNQEYWDTIKKGFSEIKKTRQAVLVSVIAVLMLSIGFLFLEYFNYSYALDLGLSAKQQSWLFGWSAVLKMIAVYLAGQGIATWQRRAVVRTYFAFFALALLPAFWSGLVGGIIIVLLVELITSVTPLITDTYTNQQFGSSQRATALAFITMLANFIYAIGIFGGLQLIDVIGSPLFYSLAGTGMLGLSLVLWIGERRGIRAVSRKVNL